MTRKMQCKLKNKTGNEKIEVNRKKKGVYIHHGKRVANNYDEFLTSKPMPAHDLIEQKDHENCI